MSEERNNPIHWRTVIPFALLLATVLAYANSLSCSFLFDDYTLVVGDMRLRQFFTAISATTRPLTRLTFHLNYRLAGAFKAADMHAVNVAIHAIAGLLLFGCLRRTLRMPALAGRYGSSADGIAGVAAGIWLLHPLQTESVTYVMQRAESLMGMFFMLSVYCLTRGLRGPAAHRWLTGAVVGSALCMASKPVAVTLPAVALLYDRAFGAGSFREAFHRRWSFHLAMAATWLILAAILSLPNESSTSTGGAQSLPSPWTYFWTQQQVVLHYLRLFLWPRGLCLDYAWPPVSVWSDALRPAMIMFPLFGLTLWALKRNTPAGFAGIWFFLNLAPTSSVLPIADCAFEHRVYVPLAGIAALAACGAYGWLKPRAQTALRVAAAICVLGALAALTAARNADYRTEIGMWADVVAKRPGNLRARNDLAVALSEAGRVEEAIGQYQTVLRSIPAESRQRLDAGDVVERGVVPCDSYSYHYFRAHLNMGWLLFTQRGEKAEAVRHLAAALRVIPYHETARAMLRRALLASGIREADLDVETQKLLRHNTTSE